MARNSLQGAAVHRDNRRVDLLDAAARRLRHYGYDGTSLRDIAGDVGMRAGSVYYHFPSKDRFLVAVYEEGVRRLLLRVREAVATRREAWKRLEAACVAHLETLLDGGDYSQVVIRVIPHADMPVFAELVSLRDRYETIFRELIEALPLPAGVNRKSLRLLLLGALNWSQVWYRPTGDKPSAIARSFVELLRRRLDHGAREKREKKEPPR